MPVLNGDQGLNGVPDYGILKCFTGFAQADLVNHKLEGVQVLTKVGPGPAFSLGHRKLSVARAV